ncbi:hypothetical protein GCM10025867_37550 [Frondihabitans sucicola]|uniref:Uncharacterized protein n=1 Tax=Frondihabitans sucicola TaxID=1268041 RepID=A0ABN6Y2H8_9MICO|nr:hypothetical protein GCM10025867_37550 [Frondihabitans sucicola]
MTFFTAVAGVDGVALGRVGVVDAGSDAAGRGLTAVLVGGTPGAVEAAPVDVADGRGELAAELSRVATACAATPIPAPTTTTAPTIQIAVDLRFMLP